MSCNIFYSDGNALTVEDKHIYISVSVFLFGGPNTLEEVRAALKNGKQKMSWSYCIAVEGQGTNCKGPLLSRLTKLIVEE